MTKKKLCVLYELCVKPKKYVIFLRHYSHFKSINMENNTTLLVTTDFSSNSKAGIRFAIQLAKQTGCHLVFYHVIDRLTPTMWTKDAADIYAGINPFLMFANVPAIYIESFKYHRQLGNKLC
jgi:nucleotide-binding universal stress UspA family protein